MSILENPVIRNNYKKISTIAVLTVTAAGIFYWSHKPKLQPIPNIFPLITAGNTEGLRAALVKTPAATLAVDLDGNTALHIAAIVGDAEILELLLSRGANPNTLNNRGESPLLSAIGAPRNAPATIKLLLDAGADPRQKLAHASSVLHSAARTISIDPQVVSLLLKDSSQLEQRDESGQTPLELARQFNNAGFLSAVRQVAVAH